MSLLNPPIEATHQVVPSCTNLLLVGYVYAYVDLFVWILNLSAESSNFESSSGINKDAQTSSYIDLTIDSDSSSTGTTSNLGLWIADKEIK